MKKNNKRLLWNYINGEEIPNIENLEDNLEFMKEVIKITKDIKIYELCSDKLKTNYEFIKFILTFFKNDEKVLKKIEKDYISKLNKRDPKYIELVFLLSSFETTSNMDSIYLNYLLERQAIYLLSRVKYKKLIENNKNIEKKYGLGFLIIKSEVFTKYLYSEIILEYYAQKLLENIFSFSKDYNIEEIIHIKYKKPNKIKELGIKNFIINYIKIYDKHLSDYVATHIHLIKDIEEKVKKIIENYEQYECNILDIKNDIFEEQANNIIDEYSSYLDLISICIHLNKKIKVPYLYEFTENIPGKLDYIEENSLPLNELRCIKEIEKLILKIYSPKTTKTTLEKIDKSKYIKQKYKTKILRFKPNN